MILLRRALNPTFPVELPFKEAMPWKDILEHRAGTDAISLVSMVLQLHEHCPYSLNVSHVSSSPSNTIDSVEYDEAITTWHVLFL